MERMRDVWFVVCGAAAKSSACAWFVGECVHRTSIRRDVFSTVGKYVVSTVGFYIRLRLGPYRVRSVATYSLNMIDESY
jgi:hypothetical protein